MADYEENLKKLRAIAAASAAKLAARSQAAGQSWPPPPSSKRPRLADGNAANAAAGEPGAAPYTVIQVPDTMVGSLIGRGGQFIRQIQAESGVKVSVGRLVDEGGLRRVCIEGAADCQAKARELIEAQVAGWTAQAARQAIAKQVQVAEILQVPERFVGLLIGRGGENIKRVSEAFRVAASFDKERTPGSESRTLTIRGTADAVARAREQVEYILLDLHRRAGLFNAALEEKYGAEQGLQGSQLLPEGSWSAAEAAAFGVATPVEGAQLAAGGAAWPPQAPPYPAAAPDPEHEAAAAAQAESYLQQIRHWAAYYAREPACVAHYLELRAAVLAGA